MTNSTNYRPRIADRLLARKLKGKGAVLIEGADRLLERLSGSVGMGQGAMVAVHRRRS